MIVSHQRSGWRMRPSQIAVEQSGSAMSNVSPTSRPVNDAGATPMTVTG